MSAGEALQRLGQSSAEACLGVLEMFAAGGLVPWVRGQLDATTPVG